MKNIGLPCIVSLHIVPDATEEDYHVYDQLGSQGQLIELTDPKTINREDAISNYKRMIRTKKGKEYRKNIFNHNDSSLCPYCLKGEANTIDHYLPKSDFPFYVLYVKNLIPSCMDCNSTKATSIGKTLHPYYDDINNTRCLYANVNETDPISITYFIAEHEKIDINEILYTRVRTHFENFNLARLYTAQAAREIGVISGLLEKSKDIKAKMKLLEDYTITTKDNFGINSWQYSFYDALSEYQFMCSNQTDPVNHSV